MKILSLITSCITFLLMNTNPAHADRPDYMIECNDAKEELNWGIQLKSDLTLGTFSDDQFEVAMKKTSVRFDETSFPSVTEYTFKGQNGEEKAEFIFTLETLQAVLKTAVNTPNEKKIRFECYKATNSIDWNVVRNVIKNARRQGGSTRY